MKYEASTAADIHYCSKCGEAIYPGDWVYFRKGTSSLVFIGEEAIFCTPEHFRRYYK